MNFIIAAVILSLQIPSQAEDYLNKHGFKKKEGVRTSHVRFFNPARKASVRVNVEELGNRTGAEVLAFFDSNCVNPSYKNDLPPSKRPLALGLRWSASDHDIMVRAVSKDRFVEIYFSMSGRKVNKNAVFDKLDPRKDPQMVEVLARQLLAAK